MPPVTGQQPHAPTAAGTREHRRRPTLQRGGCRRSIVSPCRRAELSPLPQHAAIRPPGDRRNRPRPSHPSNARLHPHARGAGRPLGTTARYPPSTPRGPPSPATPIYYVILIKEADKTVRPLACLSSTCTNVHSGRAQTPPRLLPGGWVGDGLVVRFSLYL